MTGCKLLSAMTGCFIGFRYVLVVDSYRLLGVNTVVVNGLCKLTLLIDDA